MKYLTIAFLFASVVATVFGQEDALVEQTPRDLTGFGPSYYQGYYGGKGGKGAKGGYYSPQPSYPVYQPQYPPSYPVGYYGGKGGKGAKGGYYSPAPVYPSKCDSSPYCYGGNCCKQNCYEVCYGVGGKGGKGGSYNGGYYGGKGGKGGYYGQTCETICDPVPQPAPVFGGKGGKGAKGGYNGGYYSNGPGYYGYGYYGGKGGKGSKGGCGGKGNKGAPCCDPNPNCGYSYLSNNCCVPPKPKPQCHEVCYGVGSKGGKGGNGGSYYGGYYGGKGGKGYNGQICETICDKPMY